MRLRLIITLCLSLYLSNLFSQDSISVINRYEVDYDFLYSQYIDVFSKTPSLLTEWKHDDWAYIGAGYDLTKGDFRNPQAYNSLSQLNILTESILKPETGNWIFHGKFLYSNGTARMFTLIFPIILAETDLPIIFYKSNRAIGICRIMSLLPLQPIRLQKGSL